MKKNAGWRNIVFYPYLFFFLYPAKYFNFLRKGNFKAMNALTKGIFDGLFKKETFVYTKEGKKVPYKKIE